MEEAFFEDTLLSATAYPNKGDIKSEIIVPHKTISLLGPPKVIQFGKGGIPDIVNVDLEDPVKTNVLTEITESKPFHKAVLTSISYFEIGVNQGLESPFISSIFKDSRGLFWFGSRRGITKYDGYKFTYYQLAEDHKHRLVGGICEDKQGNIWISFSAEGGLMKFDGRNFFEYPTNESLGLNEGYLGIIGVDPSGNIWLKGHSTILRMKDKHLTVFPYKFQDLEDLNVIMKLGKEGQVWLSALGGLVNVSSDVMTYHPIEDFDQKNLCHPIMINGDSCFVSTGKGVTIMTKDSLVIYKSDFISNNKIRNSLAIDKDFILASEEKNNAFCFVNGLEIRVVWEAMPVYSNARPLFVDSDKNVWLSEYGKGVYKYNPYGLKHYKFEGIQYGGPVSSIAGDAKGNIWCGGHGSGLIKYANNQFLGLDLLPEVEEIRIRSLLLAQDGRLWVGTIDQGCFVVSVDSGSGQYVVERLRLDAENYGIYALEQDQKGNVWVGTFSNGLIKVSSDGSIAEVKYQSGDSLSSIAAIRSIVLDDNGDLFVGSQSQGVFSIKSSTNEAMRLGSKEGLPSDAVVSMFVDSKNSLWLGYIDAGLSLVSGDSIWHFNADNALTSNAVWSIVEDKGGNIWVGADNTINLILNDTDGKNFQFKALSSLAGMEGGEFYSNAVWSDGKGDLWWGTDQFVTKIENTAYYAQLEVPEIYLNDLKIVNNQIDFIELEELTNSHKTKLIGVDESYDLSRIEFDGIHSFTNCPKELSLPAQFNDLTFEFALNDPVRAPEVVYSFMLSGVDNQWTEPSSKNSISYHALPAGKYQLKAKASMVSGIWSEPIVYEFEVLPVWYKTFPAKLLWVLLFLTLVSLVFFFFRKRRVEKRESEAIKQLVAMKTELYSNVTHEFRTPLTLIMGMAERLNASSREKEVIVSNSQKLLRHVNELLDVAKNESGLQTLSWVQADLVEVLKVNFDYFKSIAAEKGVALTFYTEEDEILMDFDEEKIQQITYNLLSNAIKFTSKNGKIILHVKKEVKGSQSYAVFKVKDNGVGIAETNLDQIFDRFFQTEDGSSQKGTGIGLSLTKGFVELMKGRISVSSRLGEGTVFEVSLPITQEAPLLEETDEMESLENEGLTTKDLDRKELLIIEDNVELAQYVYELFADRYKVYLAKNGVEGVQMAREKVPDAIISDVAMPEMDGFEVCNALKTDEVTSHIPIILLTAKVLHEDKMKGLTFGADVYLTKPFKQDELLLRVDKLIALRRDLQHKYANTKIDKGEVSTDPEDNFMTKLADVVTENLDNPDFGVTQLAAGVNLSQMQLYRKLKALTGKTPTQLIRTQRLNEAKKLLMESELTISEVAYQVGFSDPNYFSRVFHKEFGAPPNQVRK